MRKNKMIPMTFVMLASAVMACTDPGETTGDPNGIKGSAKDAYWSKSGNELVYVKDRWAAVGAIADKPYPGTISAAGNIDIPNVPVGPYWLDLTSPQSKNFPDAPPLRTFIETDARFVDIGRLFTGRSDIAPMTKFTHLVLDVTFTIPVQQLVYDDMGQLIQPLSDKIYFVSRGAALWGVPGESFDGVQPSHGATKVQGWTFPLDQFYDYINGGQPLVDASKGDDFVVLHNVDKIEGSSMPDGDPWTGYHSTSTQEAFETSSLKIEDGFFNKLTVDFKPVMQKNFALDYKGSAFSDLLPAGFTGSIALSMSVFMEVGTPNPGVGTAAELWGVGTSSETVYTNPDPVCQKAGCDAMACPSGCDAGMRVHPGDHAHSYTYGNPFSYGHERFNLEMRFAAGLFTMSAPAADVNGKPLSPALSFPQNIKVGGNVVPYNQSVIGIGTTTPTISWEAPAMGKPIWYRINVVDLTDLVGTDGTTSTRRTVGVMYTTATQVTIPDGIMKSGAEYYFQVFAEMRDKHDSAQPFVYPERRTTAGLYTGAVTP